MGSRTPPKRGGQCLRRPQPAHIPAHGARVHGVGSDSALLASIAHKPFGEYMVGLFTNIDVGLEVSRQYLM